MKVCEIEPIIQGEGPYVGYPMLMIRLSGCNLNCEWCDTNHSKYKEMTQLEVLTEIQKSNLDYILWTGGEPTLQIDNILDIIYELSLNGYGYKEHHLESNGTYDGLLNSIHYMSISPKNKDFFTNCRTNYDIKVVTNLEDIGMDLIQYATILMPFTIKGDKKKNLKIKRRVYDYCIEHNLRYSPRLQIDLRRK